MARAQGTSAATKSKRRGAVESVTETVTLDDEMPRELVTLHDDAMLKAIHAARVAAERAAEWDGRLEREALDEEARRNDPDAPLAPVVDLAAVRRSRRAKGTVLARSLKKGRR